MPISPATPEPFLDDLDGQSILTADAAPIDSLSPGMEPEEKLVARQKRAALFTSAIAGIDEGKRAAKQKEYDDTGAFWERRDELRRYPEGRAAHNARMKKVMSKLRDDQAAADGRVIKRRLNLKDMTSEEKADHKRVQDRLRQGNRRAKSGSTSITAAPVNIIASRTMRPECELDEAEVMTVLQHLHDEEAGT